jgi:hypothetical protein
VSKSDPLALSDVGQRDLCELCIPPATLALTSKRPAVNGDKVVFFSGSEERAADDVLLPPLSANWNFGGWISGDGADIWSLVMRFPLI